NDLRIGISKAADAKTEALSFNLELRKSLIVDELDKILDFLEIHPLSPRSALPPSDGRGTLRCDQPKSKPTPAFIFPPGASPLKAQALYKSEFRKYMRESLNRRWLRLFVQDSDVTVTRRFLSRFGVFAWQSRSRRMSSSLTLRQFFPRCSI